MCVPGDQTRRPAATLLRNGYSESHPWSARAVCSRRLLCSPQVRYWSLGTTTAVSLQFSRCLIMREEVYDRFIFTKSGYYRINREVVEWNRLTPGRALSNKVMNLRVP